MRGRNSNNRLAEQLIDWHPQVNIEQGMRLTLDWIRGEVSKTGSSANLKTSEIMVQSTSSLDMLSSEKK